MPNLFRYFSDERKSNERSGKVHENISGVTAEGVNLHALCSSDGELKQWMKRESEFLFVSKSRKEAPRLGGLFTHFNHYRYRTNN